jgi:hypothetical protein
MINGLAMDAASSQLPEFMNGARDQIIYNAIEPDRWREEGRTSVMNTAQAPDHFFDSELWGAISTIEPDRYAFMGKARRPKVPLIKVGYLPYAMVENTKLVNAFRFWRNAKTPADRIRRSKRRVRCRSFGPLCWRRIATDAYEHSVQRQLDTTPNRRTTQRIAPPQPV